MSHTVGIRELRQQASRLLKRVVAGETIEITDHGHPIARLVPLRPGPLEQMIQDGRATRADGDLLDILDGFGLPMEAPPGTSLSSALADLRRDER